MRARHLLLALALLAVAAPRAMAAALSCTAVSSACDADSDGYCEANDADTWGGSTPTAADSITITAPCKVEIPAGVTVSVDTHRQDGVGAELLIHPGGILDFDDCDDTAADQSDSECGPINGAKFSAQGQVLIDSTAHNFAWTTSSVIAGDGNTLRVHPTGSVIGSWPVSAPAAGDWFQLTSGLDKHAVYQVEAVDFSGCPTAGTTCRVDLRLYDPGMAYANVGGAGWGVGSGSGSVDTTNRKTLMRFLNDGGTSVGGRRAYIGGPTAPAYSTAAVGGVPTPLDRCIELCTTETGNVDFVCTASDVLSANGDYVGWRIETLAGVTPGGNTGFSAIITHSYNDLTLSGTPGSQATDGIADGGAVVDRVCFDQPLPSAVGATALIASPRIARDTMLTPPLKRGDSFIIWRPAIARASGTEWDAGFSARNGGILDCDYCEFRHLAMVYASGTGLTSASDLQPIRYGVIVPKAIGGGAGVGTQNGAENGRALKLPNFTGLRLGPVAIIDANVPTNVGPTGTNTSCPDKAPYDGSCDAAGVADADTTSGFHALDLVGSSGTVTGIYCRYMGDDCVTATTAGAGLTFIDPYGWWTALGGSTEFIEVASPMTVSNARSYAYVNVASGQCGGVLKTGDNSNLTILSVNGLASAELIPSKFLSNTSTFSGSRSGSTGKNLIGRVHTVSGNCASCDGASCSDSWFYGNSQILANAVSLRRVFAWLGTGTSVVPIGSFTGSASKAIGNAIFNVPNLAVVGADAVSTSWEITDNLFEWAAASSSAGLGIWNTTDTALAGDGIENNILVNRGVIQVNDTTWGNANCALVGVNYAVSATSATAGLIINPSNCTAAAAQYGITAEAGFGSTSPINLLPAGPSRAGVPATAGILDFLPTGASFVFGVAGSGGGGSSDTIFTPGIFQ